MDQQSTVELNHSRNSIWSWVDSSIDWPPNWLNSQNNRLVLRLQLLLRLNLKLYLIPSFLVHIYIQTLSYKIFLCAKKLSKPPRLPRTKKLLAYGTSSCWETPCLRDFICLESSLLDLLKHRLVKSLVLELLGLFTCQVSGLYWPT